MTDTKPVPKYLPKSEWSVDQHLDYIRTGEPPPNPDYDPRQVPGPEDGDVEAQLDSLKKFDRRGRRREEC